MSAAYKLTRDPIFYTTVALFAVLTTGLPAIIGQPNFMPLVQALGITIFTGAAIRQGEIRNAVGIAALWLGLEFLVILVVTLAMPGSAERAIGNGFEFRTSYLQWFYTGHGLPHALLAEPVGRMKQLAGVILGSLLTGGLVGSWFLVKAVNLLAFSMGSLTAQLGPVGLVAGIAPWALATVTGYAGLFVALSEPILNNNWKIAHYIQDRRWLLLGSLGFVLAGIVLELILPGAWSSLFRPEVGANLRPWA
jgi:hypothetical protein